MNPNSADAHDWYGNYLAAVGNYGPALQESESAHKLDPLSLPIYSDLLSTLVVSRQYDRAIAESRRAIESHPDFAYGYAWLGMAYMLKGQTKDAVKVAQEGYRRDPNVSITTFLAMAHAADGNKAEALKLVDDLEKKARSRYVCAYEVSGVYVQLHDNQKAVQWLHRGEDEQCDCQIWLRSEPWMDLVRTDPSYNNFVQKVGYPAK